MEIEGYLDALASADPTPGGGSAATLVGALAAALCAMVARITTTSPKLAPVHEEAAAIAEDAVWSCSPSSLDFSAAFDWSPAAFWIWSIATAI